MLMEDFHKSKEGFMEKLEISVVGVEDCGFAITLLNVSTMSC